MTNENNINIPTDLSLFGYDDISDTVSFTLTAFRRPAIEMGQETVNLLFRLINKEVTSSCIVIPTSIGKQPARLNKSRIISFTPSSTSDNIGAAQSDEQI